MAPICSFVLLPGHRLFVARIGANDRGRGFVRPHMGNLWNLTGATLGATLAFAIARYLASDWVAMRSGERLARLMRGVEEEGGASWRSSGWCRCFRSIW